MPSFKKARALAALLIVANGVIPALWILLTSMKTETELMRVPITVLPDTPTIANYVRVFVDQPMLTFLWNSLAVATLSTLLCVGTCRHFCESPPNPPSMLEMGKETHHHCHHHAAVPFHR